MGTETSQLFTIRKAWLSLHCKLNNPLMGTETVYRNKYNRTHHYPCKLNNPLMGTETCHMYIIRFDIDILCCKLNNPLMGTETWLISFKVFIINYPFAN